MLVSDFIHKDFPSLILRPPLFYNWEIGIRFELGVGWSAGSDDKNSSYIQGVYQRAITLFESIHSQEDEIFVVVDVNDVGGRSSYKHKARIISPYIYEKSILYRLKHVEMPCIFPEDDEGRNDTTHRFTLQCKASDIKYSSMLKAVCNHDLGIQPSFFHRVYFLNIKRKTIFHVYDDRGCDLLATSAESIQNIYNTYEDWILDYDKDEIDQVFK